MDGVNTIGRRDDCLIRVRSSQVSRRHCEVYEENGTLMVRDVGSSNGTFVNGKRVLGQQSLKPGDVLTVGTVTLRVDLLQSVLGGVQTPPALARKSADTAETMAPAKVDNHEALEAVEDDELDMVDEGEEFEVAIDGEPEHPTSIPLEDEKSTPLSTNSPNASVAAKVPMERSRQARSPLTATNPESDASEPESSSSDDDAVAQFLMDLKLDEDD
jgi:pSer/pThr/pTyr-binding forkhead associated (FHA) protein